MSKPRYANYHPKRLGSTISCLWFRVRGLLLGRVRIDGLVLGRLSIDFGSRAWLVDGTVQKGLRKFIWLQANAHLCV